jgi:hypothetical protein
MIRSVFMSITVSFGMNDTREADAAVGSENTYGCLAPLLGRDHHSGIEDGPSARCDVTRFGPRAAFRTGEAAVHCDRPSLFSHWTLTTFRLGEK